MTEFQGAQAEVQLMDELARLEPREVLHPDSHTNVGSCLTRLRGPRLCAQPAATFNPKEADTITPGAVCSTLARRIRLSRPDRWNRIRSERS